MMTSQLNTNKKDINSEIFLPCSLSFERINELVAANLNGMEVNDKLTIVSADIGGEGKRMIVKVFVSGVYEGPVNISFLPIYNEIEDKFFLDELSVIVGDGGLLAKGANFVLNKVFGGKMDAKFEEVLNSKFLELKNEWLEKLKEMEVGPGIKFQSDVSFFDLQEIHEQDGKLNLNVIVKGALKMEM